MDIALEKERIIDSLRSTDDEELISTIKRLLEFDEDVNLFESVRRGIHDVSSGNTKPHKEVMTAYRSKYKPE
ncbi:MAG: hypothetical protein RJQ09_04640 [Cyclobacteriaceae bacterium]